MKTLYFDCETTGLDPVKNDLIQLAMIIEIDGVVKGEYNFNCQPFNYDTVETGALLVQKRTITEIRGWPEPIEMFESLEMVFDGHIDRFNKHDKFEPVGYNVSFDIGFLSKFFEKARPDDKFGLGSFVDRSSGFDLLWHLRNKFHVNGRPPGFPNLKLETIAKAHNIELDAHDALADIRATRELCKAYYEEFVK